MGQKYGRVAIIDIGFNNKIYGVCARTQPVILAVDLMIRSAARPVLLAQCGPDEVVNMQRAALHRQYSYRINIVYNIYREVCIHKIQHAASLHHGRTHRGMLEIEITFNRFGYAAELTSYQLISITHIYSNIQI